MKADVVNEYFLLKNYLDNSLLARGNLWNIALTSLNLLNLDKIPLMIDGNIRINRFQEADKKKLQSILQIELIAHIMMLAEDFIIFAESFRQKRNFYELITSNESKDDLGFLIENFLKNIDVMSDHEIYKILNYVDPATCNLKKSDQLLLEKIVNTNIQEIRRIIKELGDFGKIHHPFYRNYKHAGFPIVPGFPVSKEGLMKDFDSCLIAFTGKDPINDVMFLPLSKKVIDGYSIIFGSLQGLVQDIVTNRIGTIEREIDGIFPNITYAPHLISKDEWKQYGKVLTEFGKNNSFKEIPKIMNVSKPTKEQLTWYLNLDSFIEQAKLRKAENDQAEQRLNDC